MCYFSPEKYILASDCSMILIILPRFSRECASSASICTDASSLIVIEPDDTKNFLVAASSYTVTTPGDSTANAGTWLGKMPKLPEKLGTST